MFPLQFCQHDHHNIHSVRTSLTHSLCLFLNSKTTFNSLVSSLATPKPDPVLSGDKYSSASLWVWELTVKLPLSWKECRLFDDTRCEL